MGEWGDVDASQHDCNRNTGPDVVQDSAKLYAIVRRIPLIDTCEN